MVGELKRTFTELYYATFLKLRCIFTGIYLLPLKICLKKPTVRSAQNSVGGMRQMNTQITNFLMPQKRRYLKMIKLVPCVMVLL